MRTPARLATLPSRLLGRAAWHAERISTTHLAEAGAHRWQYAVLVALDADGPASQAALSEATGVHRSDLVAVINGLEAAGHVARTPDLGDRRRNVVTLTAAGRARLRDLDRVVDAAQAELLTALSPTSRDTLVTLLRELVDHHADHDLPAGQPGQWR